MESCLYEGFVRHRRFGAVPHEFRFPLFLAYLDLAELDEVFRGRWLWSTSRPAPLRFRREDHLGDPRVPLDEAVRDLVAEHTGKRPGGPVRLLTQYDPLVYAPYVPALWIARALDLSAAAGLLLARLFGLACWLAGLWRVLRVAPCQRWLLAAAALLPLSVFQAGAVSADPLTQLAVFWWFAEWLRASSGSL